ncbi:carbohydrate ABC transporter permease [Cohnella cellulosilytica]|uniref:Carbohydrate ABC transporter permease n=1 Tax=Cohnella cellulosilytica TaxID=986710 RepID=A0ABW2FF79_9BACL
MFLIFAAVLYPMLFIFSASFSAPSAVIGGKVWAWPVDFTLDGYRAVFQNPAIVTGFTNSLIYMLLGTAINLIVTVLGAYPLARRDLVGRELIMGLFVFTMIFSGGLVPAFLLVKDLGLYNTRWAILLPAALSVFNMIITKTYFQTTIPQELHEAAEIDGSSDFKTMLSIVIPLSGPILAVIGLYYAVGHWNSYFSAMIFLRDNHLYPLQVILRDILITNTVDPIMLQDFDAIKRKQGLVDVLKFSTIVVASAPMFAIYPFVQRYFVKGIMIGSIKG